MVPAYNEECYIQQVIATIPSFVDHIVVVDDCSTDKTYKVATNSGDGRVVVMQTLSNSGGGAATILGYRKALDLDSGIVVKMDGDGQMPPEYLPALLDQIVERDYDYVKGNRFLGEHSLAQMPKYRIFGNFALTFLTKLASGYWHIFDVENGYTAIRGDCLKELNLGSIAKDHFIVNDLLVQLNIRGRRVADVAIPAIYIEKSSTMSTWKTLVGFPPRLLNRFFKRVYYKYVLYNFHPIAMFLFLGLLLFLFGVGLGIALLVIGTLASGRQTPTGMIMFSVVPLILGFQLLLQAIVLDIYETPR